MNQKQTLELNFLHEPNHAQTSKASVGSLVVMEGILKCQENSYLKIFRTKVVSSQISSNGNYDVVLEDTIIFPEGIISTI